nr:unnamed protein product [Leishmania braziliensis]
MAAADQLRYAAQLIELARSEETEDGNPLTAVRYYTTAMEIIASEASNLAASITRNEARRFFLFQVRSKLDMYYQRAELLLQVASGSGLLDKPSIGNGDTPPFQVSYPPALYTPVVASDKSNSGDGAGGGGSVLGIPLLPQQMMPTASPPQTQSGHGNSNELPISLYLKPDDDGTAAPPPVTSELDLDKLMKNLGAPPDM